MTEEILRRGGTVRHVESAVFTDLADEYGAAVYRFCRSLTYSKEDADDLFQETFLSVLERPAKIAVTKDTRSFLFSAALYIWKSQKRKYARRQRLAPSKPLDETYENVQTGGNTEDEFEVKEEIRNVRALVASLPDKFKIPVVLHYGMEMQVADIAEFMNIPRGTVKSRLFHARKIIEKGLGKNYDNE